MPFFERFQQNFRTPWDTEVAAPIKVCIAIAWGLVGLVPLLVLIYFLFLRP